MTGDTPSSTSDQDARGTAHEPGPQHCLAGGGELGALMRAKDWASTPFGPVTSWPQSLCTAVSMMLESRFGMAIAWGPEFRFLYNDRYRPVLGATKHPGALGSPAREIFPEAWAFLAPLFGRTRQGEAVALDDVLIPLHRNGYLENCYFTISYSPIRDESGGIGGMLAVVAETTERVESERRLVTLRTLAGISSEVKSVELACEAAARALGNNPVDVPFSLLYLVEQDGKRARLAAWSGLSAGGAASPMHVDLTEPADGRDWSRAWPLASVAASGTPLIISDVPRRFGALTGGPYPEATHTAVILPMKRSGTGLLYGLLILGVSPRRALDARYQTFFELTTEHVVAALANAHAYEEERKRAEALAELDRAKTIFFSNVSHEFRTPLTLLLAQAEDILAGRAGPISNEVRERMQVLDRNALRLLKLVNSLLDFSRIEAGRIQATFAPTDLATYTAELASTFRSAMERAGLTLTIACQPLDEPVYVDHEMWEKIVLNLLSNAFKFTFEGEVVVSLALEDELVRLDVRDTGIGIAAHELPRLFERFYRIEGARSRTHEGSGIGLALVNELVRMHGGTMHVSSTAGQGSTFTVLLQRGMAHLPPDRIGVIPTQASTRLGAAAFVEEAHRWLPSSEPDHEPDSDMVRALPHRMPSSARILLADDNADMREYLTRLLGQRWTVEAVADGSTALARAIANPPDLLLTDVMMPGLDGFALLRELRAHAQTQHLPVIILSARAGEESRVEGLEAGADDYLVKPFSARELLARVQAHLELSQVRLTASDNLQKLASAALTITSSLSLDVILDRITGEARQVIGAHQAVTSITVNEDWAQAITAVSVSDKYAAYRNYVEAPDGSGIYSLVCQTNRPMRMTQAELVAHPAWRGFGSAADKHPPMRGWLAAPLSGTDGRNMGLIQLSDKYTGEFTAADEAILVQLAQLASVAIQNARLYRDLREAHRRKDEFLALLGHELRNPLAPIVTALELMKLRRVQGVERERAVIERQVRHMVQLVDDLLDVSRIMRGKIQLKPEPIEIAAILARAIEMASPLLEQRSHKLSVVAPRSGMAVHGDPMRLAQVFSNLLTNAAKYTPSGGHISMVATPEGQRIRVRVKDNGMGIPADLLPYIFDAFTQGERFLEGSAGGLGLGLSLVRSLVEMHHGKVTAHSDGRGRGSTFTVELPACAAEMLAARPAAASEAGIAAGASERILIVDDNPDAAEMLAEALRTLGYEIAVAHDGPEALSMTMRFTPRIAILDLGLPVMDGYELARRLREQQDGTLRLIALTGYGQESDRERTRAAGFDSHLIKPVDLEALVTLLRRHGRD